MSKASAPYGRRKRILARLDFSWGVSGRHLAYIAEQDIWTQRFRPGGPHGLWIAGHLAYYEAGAANLYKGLEGNPLSSWKDTFGNGSPVMTIGRAIPIPGEILERLNSGRQEARKAIAALSNADLDRSVHNERLAIRDLQSQIEFLIWHDSHHAAQLGGIVNTHMDGLA